MIYNFPILCLGALTEKNYIWYGLFIFGWTLPLIPLIASISIVIITGGSFVSNSSQNCWLSDDGHLRLSFLVPVNLIIIINLVIMTLCIVKAVTTIKSKNSYQKAKAVLYAFMILSPVLGFPWIIMFIRLVLDIIQVNITNEGTQTINFLDWVFILLNAPSGLIFFIIILHRYIIYIRSDKNNNSHRIPAGTEPQNKNKQWRCNKLQRTSDKDQDPEVHINNHINKVESNEESREQEISNCNSEDNQRTTDEDLTQAVQKNKSAELNKETPEIEISNSDDISS